MNRYQVAAVLPILEKFRAKVGAAIAGLPLGPNLDIFNLSKEIDAFCV